MGYAVYCRNYIKPAWSRFKPVIYNPSKMALFLKYIGFSGEYNKQMRSIFTEGYYDPAHKEIAFWCQKFELPSHSFYNRPKFVNLEKTTRPVSRVYDSKDECSTVFDLKFNSGDAFMDDYYGHGWVWGVNDGLCSLTTAYIYNEFWVAHCEE